MIRILYMSDLHLEMESWRLPRPGWSQLLARRRAVARHPTRGPLLQGFDPVDLIVLAGDIHNGLRGLVYADQVAKFFSAPVIYVAGNHEFYYQDMARLLPAARAASVHTEGRVHFLENNHVALALNGTRLHVLGCTLWTDYEINGHPDTAMRMAARRMNDHRFIREDADEPLRPQAALERHRASRVWLHKTLAGLHRAEPGAKKLIVTHHAPSASFLGPRHGAIAPAYASDLLIEFSVLRPSAWIHGHTHHRHESEEEGILVRSAPRGYVAYDGEAAMAYRPGLLEI